jgi:hypothetical protein
MSASNDNAQQPDQLPDELPWYRDFVARYVAFPTYCGTTSFDRATRDFVQEVRRIEEVCGHFSPNDFVCPVSVSTIIGLEDDERDWSAAMVVEHIVLVSEAIGRTLVFLTRGQQPPVPFSREEMRPRGAKGVTILPELHALGRSYPQLVEAELGPQRDTVHRHPIFGDLDCARWHCLSVSHLRVHRRQLHEIRRRLSAKMRQNLLGSLLFPTTTELDPQV